MATPIKLYSISQRNISSGEVVHKSVVARSSITKNTTSKTNVSVGKLKKTTAKNYNIKKGKKGYIGNNALVKTETSNWYNVDPGNGGQQYQKRTCYETKRFKKTTGTGNNKKYYYWDVRYYCWYETRYDKSTHVFTEDEQPMSMVVTLQDLDIEDDNVGTDVGRDRKTGTLVRHRVRTNVRTVEIEFPPMRQSTIHALMPFISNTGGQGYCELTYDDPYEGRKTIYCYAGDRTFEANHNGWWTGFKVTFVEV